MIERERRFLVASLPEPLPQPSRIQQAYLTTGPASVRVRRSDDQHTLTVKTGSGRNRHEIERDLSPDEFAVIWEAATDLRISKQRHRIDLGDGHTAELEHEFSDVLAWVATLANLVDVDLSVVADRYRDGCPKCGHLPCAC